MLMELGGMDISREAWPFHCGEDMESCLEAQGGEKFFFHCIISLTGSRVNSMLSEALRVGCSCSQALSASEWLLVS